MKNLLSGLGAIKLKTDFSKQSKITLIGYALHIIQAI